MKIGANYFLIFILIFVIAGCAENELPASVDSEQTRAASGKGCCYPFCAELTESDCIPRGGTYTASPCSMLEGCKTGCCLPFCQSMKQSECSADIGYGGEWREGSCNAIEECNKICCTPFFTLNTETECAMLGGKAEEASKCDVETLKGTLSIGINYDHTCDCGSSETSTCTTKNGITEKLTASFVPDPNPARDDLFGNYGNKKYLKGEGTYTISGFGESKETTHGEYVCEVPPPAHNFKIPITTTRTTRDEVSGSQTGNVHLIIQEGSDGLYYFYLSPDFPTIGTKIRTMLRTDERKSCSDSSEDANSEEMDEDPPVEIEGNLPLEFSGEALEGTISFESYPPSMRTCEQLTTGTISFDFENIE